MHTKEELEELYGEDEASALWTYVGNKVQGGRNNSKGNVFENHFAVYKLASLMHTETNQDTVLLSSQVKAFIDDLVIEKTVDKTNEYYQIKDVASLGWNDPAHPLSKDVSIQHDLCTSSGIQPQIEIVVSKKEVQGRLIDHLPGSLQNKVTITHFPAATSINNQIRNNQPFKTALAQICSLNNPTTDKLDVVGNLLLGVWGGIAPEKVPLKRYIDGCHASNPNFFKGAGTKLSDKLAAIFANIRGFNYTLQNGYISWTYEQSDNGVIPHAIGTWQFEQWENDIFQLDPISTFDDIEPYLSKV